MALAIAGLAQGDATPHPLTVTWQNGRLAVKGTGVPYRELLLAIANRTGVEVQGLDTLGGAGTSVQFANLPLHDGLKTVLAQLNYAIVGDAYARPGEGRILAIVLGHKSGGASTASEREPAPSASAPATTTDPESYRALERLAEHADIAGLREAALFGDATTRGLAMQRLARHDPAEARRIAADVVTSKDASQRVFAVHVLAGSDGADAISALSATLEDADVEVRRATLVALLDRSSPAAIAMLTRAIQDREPSIRTLAIEILARRGPAGIPGVIDALNDRDPFVRAQAQTALDRLGASE